MHDALVSALRWVAHHTGIPVLVVAALMLVVAWHVLRRWFRFFVQIALALAILVVLTELGWITW